MQHNIVRKHRRTVSLINMEQNSEQENKTTQSVFQDIENIKNKEINKVDHIIDKAKQKLRHRAISDLIQASNKISESKSVIVQDLHVSINYKDPVFQFGKDKKLKELSQNKNMFKKYKPKQLDCIAEKSTQPKANRLFLRKKIDGIQSQKTTFYNKPQSIFLAKSDSKTVKNIGISVNSKPGVKAIQKPQNKQLDILKKEREKKKLQIKKNFKF